MTDLGKKENIAERHGFLEETDEFFENNLEVYTTPYGTQYVLPIDLLLPMEEMREYLKELRAQRLEKENGR